MAKRRLYLIQDSDRPVHVIADSWQHALERWRCLLQAENNDNDAYEPEGIILVAEEEDNFTGLLI